MKPVEAQNIISPHERINMKNNNVELYYTPFSAAKIFNVAEKTIYNLIKNKELEAQSVFSSKRHKPIFIISENELIRLVMKRLGLIVQNNCPISGLCDKLIKKGKEL